MAVGRYLTERKLPTTRTIFLLTFLLGIVGFVNFNPNPNIEQSNGIADQLWFIKLLGFVLGASTILVLLYLWRIAIIAYEFTKLPSLDVATDIVYNENDAIRCMREEIKDAALASLTDDQLKRYIFYASDDSSMTQTDLGIRQQDLKKLQKNLSNEGIDLSMEQIITLADAEDIYLQQIGAIKK